MEEKNASIEVLNALLPFLHHAHRVFDTAVTHSLGQFEQDSEEFENSHYSNTVRYKARIALDKDQAIFGHKLGDLNNNGIHVFLGDYEIKFVKGRNRRPPSAGRSITRRNYYQQQLFDDALPTKLVVIWNVTTEGAFLGLDLACTASDDFKTPKLHWLLEVPHPATMHNAASKHDDKSDDLDSITHANEEDDLGISKSGTDDK